MISIKLLKWDKYNKRQKDIVRPFWYAMSNRFFYDPDFIEFKNEEKLTFFFILGEASQQNKYGEVLINETLYSRITGLNKQTLLNTIDKLLILGAAAGSRQDGGKIATATVHNITLHNNKNVLPDGNTCVLDFELIYKEYPNRLGNKGKKDGLASLCKKIKSKKDFDRAMNATKVYNLICNKNKITGTDKVAMFSTFFGTKDLWLDHADVDINEIKNNEMPKILKLEKSKL